jgi:hypothetical protein
MAASFGTVLVLIVGVAVAGSLPVGCFPSVFKQAGLAVSSEFAPRTTSVLIAIDVYAAIWVRPCSTSCSNPAED